ncbi:hypothetical protein FQN60_011385 [Etheostoma spectabile]|uniref:Uncharacterized protein n=1 Tax=Etheostoma spectabile TaxID=54343 RepID=A0A5J5DRN2_9PERO|nr:hypothetical protein FQN60_011385 [Etheostoma spectabile]
MATASTSQHCTGKAGGVEQPRFRPMKTASYVAKKERMKDDACHLKCLREQFQFCPTSDTLPWVNEPDIESQSGDALLNARHLRLCAAPSRALSAPAAWSKDILAGSQAGCIAHAHCPRQLPEVFVVNH